MNSNRIVTADKEPPKLILLLFEVAGSCIKRKQVYIMYTKAVSIKEVDESHR